jgi:hypothetical protein
LPLLVAVVAAALVPAAATASATQRLETPQLAEIARGPAAIPEAPLLKRAGPGFLEPGTYWGGTYSVASGETVNVYASNTYPQDAATGQRWADFLAALVHGSELSKLTIYLAPLNELQRICGPQTLGCYSSQQQLLVAPGDDPSTNTSAEAVVTHEYGHHVAANRSNAPWEAVDYGTKRWASYEQICARAEKHEVFPGAESLPQYRFNPGEAFAETYRVLNERLAAVAEVPWQVVDSSFYPDDVALGLVQQDVASPWLVATSVGRTGAVTKNVRIRAFSVATPLDGTVTVTLTPPAGSRLAIGLWSSGTRVAQAVSTRRVTLTTTVCGKRSLQIRVGRLTASGGAFQLAITTP